jgi:hypothetical protein
MRAISSARPVVRHVHAVPHHLEQGREAVGRVDVVLDEEDARVLGAIVARHRRRRAVGIVNDGEGDGVKMDHELRALAEAGAARLDPATVQLDQALHDREPDAEPALYAREAPLRLREEVEDACQHLGRDPDAVVAHADRDLAAGVDDLDRDAAPGLGVLRGVADEVCDHLLQAGGVAVDQDVSAREGHGERVGAVVDQGARRLDRALDDAVDDEPLRAQRDPAVRDARNVEEVVDQPAELVRAAGRDLEGAIAPGGVESRGDDGVPHGGEGISELVAEHRQELVLRAASRLRVGARASLDGVTRLLGLVPRRHVLEREDDAAHAARRVEQRRRRHPDGDRAAVAPHPNRLDAEDALAVGDRLANARTLVEPVGRDDRDLATDDLVLGPAEHALRGRIPQARRRVGLDHDDRQRRRRDDGVQHAVALAQHLLDAGAATSRLEHARLCWSVATARRRSSVPSSAL